MVRNSEAEHAWAGRRVVVAGAAGFLGSRVVRAFRGLGADVYGISRRPQGPTDPGVYWLTGDLSDPAAVNALLAEARPDLVYVLTSHGVGSPERSEMLPTLMGDLLPTVNVLASPAIESCGRIVIAASLEEPSVTPAVPASPYAAAKWAATGYARMAHALYRTPVVITRVFMTYGPGQRDHKLVPHVILSVLQGRSPRLSSGRRLVDWVYLDDVVRGLVAAGTRPGIEGQEFELGSGELLSVREMVEQLLELMGNRTTAIFGALADRPFEVERRADIGLAAAGLDWCPEIPLREGLRRTIDWYATQFAARGGAPATTAI